MFGEYEYVCQAPANFSFANNSGSGYITIDSEMEFLDIVLQNKTGVNLNITVLQQRTPLVNAKCRIENQISTTDANGVCTFSSLDANTNHTLYVTKGLLRRNAVFSVGDYYASPSSTHVCGFGQTGQCSAFLDDDRTYKYTWDMEFEQEEISAAATFNVLGELYAVEDAVTYWDGVSVGSTDKQGTIYFNVDHQFYPHTLLFSHNEFVNKSTTVCLGKEPFFVSLKMKTSSTIDDDTLSNQPAQVSQIASMFSEPQFIGSFVVASAMVGGAYYAGIAGALGIGSAISILMALNGLFPLPFALIVLFISVMFAGSSWRKTIGG